METILNAILALPLAERDGTKERPTERILAEAWLTDEHIAILTGHNPARFDQPSATAFGHSALSGAPAETS